MDVVVPSHMCTLPTELLLNIFIFLPSKDLIRCRQVCSRWKLIIDRLSRSDDLWIQYCVSDFSRVYRIARQKAKPGLPWFNLYKSLSLWSKFADAREHRDEFASASGVMYEIRNFQLLDDGTIGVQTKCSIMYYDVATLELSKRGPINGTYSKYAENEHVIVILNYQLHLYVIRKYTQPAWQESDKTFYNVKMFTLTDSEVYYVTLNDEIYVCKYVRNGGSLSATFIKQSEDSVMALGCSGNRLNMLTFARNIYTLVDNNLVFACTLSPDSNLLHQLQKFNLLEQMDWRVYVQWMYVFNHTIPDGPFRDLIIVRQYGDVYFVGSNWGVLRIYYAPCSDSEFDLFNTQPVKQINFMERSDCPVLSTCPIIAVDALECEDGHMVFVAMPKKIAVLHFTHSFKRTASLAMLPYCEVQKVKQLRIDSSCSSTTKIHN